MKHAIKQLFTNTDGRMSTTATVQFFGFVILASTLILSILLANDNSSELYGYFAMYCGGLTVSKGAVNAYTATKNINVPRSEYD